MAAKLNFDLFIQSIYSEEQIIDFNDFICLVEACQSMLRSIGNLPNDASEYKLNPLLNAFSLVEELKNPDELRVQIGNQVSTIAKHLQTPGEEKRAIEAWKVFLEIKESLKLKKEIFRCIVEDEKCELIEFNTNNLLQIMKHYGMSERENLDFLGIDRVFVDLNNLIHRIVPGFLDKIGLPQMPVSLMHKLSYFAANISDVPGLPHVPYIQWIQIMFNNDFETFLTELNVKIEIEQGTRTEEEHSIYLAEYFCINLKTKYLIPYSQIFARENAFAAEFKPEQFKDWLTSKDVVFEPSSWSFRLFYPEIQNGSSQIDEIYYDLEEFIYKNSDAAIANQSKSDRRKIIKELNEKKRIAEMRQKQLMRKAFIKLSSNILMSRGKIGVSLLCKELSVSLDQVETSVLEEFSDLCLTFEPSSILQNAKLQGSNDYEKFMFKGSRYGNPRRVYVRTEEITDAPEIVVFGNPITFNEEDGPVSLVNLDVTQINDEILVFHIKCILGEWRMTVDDILKIRNLEQFSAIFKTKYVMPWIEGIILETQTKIYTEMGQQYETARNVGVLISENLKELGKSAISSGRSAMQSAISTSKSAMKSAISSGGSALKRLYDIIDLASQDASSVFQSSASLASSASQVARQRFEQTFEQTIQRIGESINEINYYGEHQGGPITFEPRNPPPPTGGGRNQSSAQYPSDAQYPTNAQWEAFAGFPSSSAAGGGSWVNVTQQMEQPSLPTGGGGIQPPSYIQRIQQRQQLEQEQQRLREQQNLAFDQQRQQQSIAREPDLSSPESIFNELMRLYSIRENEETFEENFRYLLHNSSSMNLVNLYYYIWLRGFQLNKKQIEAEKYLLDYKGEKEVEGLIDFGPIPVLYIRVRNETTNYDYFFNPLLIYDNTTDFSVGTDAAVYSNLNDADNRRNIINLLWKMMFIINRPVADEIINQTAMPQMPIQTNSNAAPIWAEATVSSQSKRILGTVTVILNDEDIGEINLTDRIISRLKLKDFDVYVINIDSNSNGVKINGNATPNTLNQYITYDGKIHLTFEPKSKSSKSSKRGGSKTRKHRHQKKTLRRNPRKLISRRQKYSRRK